MSKLQCFFGRVLVGVSCVVAASMAARADVTNDVGLGWKVQSPDAYQITLDDGFSPGQTRPLPGINGTPAIPMKLIVPNWRSLDPVDFRFLGAKDFSGDRFSLRMLVVNDTGQDWIGFKISIRDDNNVAFYNISTQTGGPSLRHPDRAHIHSDKIISGGLGFNQSLVTQYYYTGLRTPVLQTANPDITDNKGVYAIRLFSDNGFVVADQASWRPFFVNTNNATDVVTNSVLDFHLHNLPERGNNPGFTVTMQPLAVAEPATAVLFGFGASAMLLWRRRMPAAPH